MKKIYFLWSILFFCLGAVSAQNPTLYLVGSFNNWAFQDDYAATADANGVYTWSSDTYNLSFDPSTSFKISAASWASPNLGAEDGSAISLSNGSATLNLYDNSQNNIQLPSSEVSISKIELTVSGTSYTMVITGSEGAEVDPTDYPLYIRGDVNSWLNDEIAAGTTIDSKWIGQTTDGGKTYVWDWTGEEEGYINLAGQFKFADSNYTIHNYGPTNYNEQLTYDIAEIAVVSATSNNFTTGDLSESTPVYSDLNVSKLTLDLNTGYLLLEYKSTDGTYIVLNGIAYQAVIEEVTSGSVASWTFDELNPLIVSGEVYVYEQSNGEILYYSGATSSEFAELVPDEAFPDEIVRDLTDGVSPEALIKFNATSELRVAEIFVEYMEGQTNIVFTLANSGRYLVVNGQEYFWEVDESEGTIMWTFDPALSVSGDLYLYERASQGVVQYYIGANSSTEALLTLDEGSSTTITRQIATPESIDDLIKFQVSEGFNLVKVEDKYSIEMGAYLEFTIVDKTNIEEVYSIPVYATNGEIKADENIEIFNLAGADVTSQNGGLNGIYIVKYQGSTLKMQVEQ